MGGRGVESEVREEAGMAAAWPSVVVCARGRGRPSPEQGAAGSGSTHAGAAMLDSRGP